MQTISILIPDQFFIDCKSDQYLLVIPLPYNWVHLLQDDISVKLYIDSISDGSNFGYIARRLN